MIEISSLYLGQSLHDCVQQSSDPLGHLEEFKDPGNPEDPHHPDDGGVDGKHLTLNQSDFRILIRLDNQRSVFT